MNKFLLKICCILDFSPEKRCKVWKRMQSLIQNGKNLQDSLEFLYSNESKKKSIMAVILKEIITRKRAGITFSESVRPFVSIDEYVIFMSCEKKLETFYQSFSLCVNILETKKDLKESIVMQLAYPFVLLTALLLLFYGANAVIIPQIAMVIEPDTWTGTTKLLYQISNFVNSSIFTCFLIVIIFFICSAKYFLENLHGSVRYFLDYFPIFIIYKKMSGVIFLYTLSMLVKSGASVDFAITYLTNHSSPYLKDILKKVSFYFKKGENLSEALKKSTNNFPSKEILNELTFFIDAENFFTEKLPILSNEWLKEEKTNIIKKIAIFRMICFVLIGATLLLFVTAMTNLQQNMFM